MGEMIERVAKALHEAHKPWCDFTYPWDHAMSSAPVYRELARAAIEAMLDPVEPVYVAMCDVGPDTNNGCFSIADAHDVWTAGVLAALQPDEKVGG